MIFVVDSKNKTHGPISNWNAVNVGKISKVILTDGMGITSYLSGFSKYGAEFEAISILKGNGQGVKHRVVKEIIIGVHDTKKAERELLESFNNNLKSIMDSNKNVQERINKCREKYDYMLTDLLNKRVVKKSLEIKPAQAEVYNIIGSLYNGLLDMDSAIHYMEEGRKYEPDNFNLNFNFKYFNYYSSNSAVSLFINSSSNTSSNRDLLIFINSYRNCAILTNSFSSNMHI